MFGAGFPGGNVPIPRPGQQQQPFDQAVAPVSFWEWFCAKYPPDYFVYNWQHWFVAITASASNANNPGNLNIQMPLFAFTFRSFAWVTSTGATPTFPYFIGIAMTSTNDWTGGQWASQVITGNGQSYDFSFAWPREVPATTNLTVTINNSLNNVGLTCHAGVVGLEVRAGTQTQRVGRL